MRILQGYSKRNKNCIMLFLLMLAIFTLVFFLYDLPSEPIAYATLLSAVFVGIYFTYDLWRYSQYHSDLRKLQESIIFDISGLPVPNDLLEADYQELVKALFEEKDLLASQAEKAYNELVEYYTLWVHQVKTPISAMRLLLQTNQGLPITELELELLKIEQYVEMVLHYIRVESPASDFVLKYYDLDSIVRQAVRKYAKMFIQKKISLEYSVLGCQVLTDEKWLLFVIEQVLSNALKYTIAGKISIYLVDKKTLVIEDTGIGIAEEDLPRVFEQGFTGHLGRFDKRASGIGLYLSKRILSRLSHTIAIESTVGKGTKVMIGLDTIDTVVE
ncbi:MAG: HAMP domain-containing histidine kinase [Firmicutes bacterium]|nr:HAMP domain-containing histidine kinase [Bacillota bacterium]